jgi:hypothetical protein
VPDDGVRVDLDTLAVGLIREEQEYGGVRVELVAHVTNARVRLQVDVGFGDAITPEATVVDFLALLDFPAPRLRAHPRETVVAEKLEAMVRLGMANSRMMDFCDIAVLARGFDFDGDLLTRAVRATFERRKTPLPTTTPVTLTTMFTDDPTKKTRWSGFVRKAGVDDAGSLAETVTTVAAFAEKPLSAAAGGPSLRATWHAPGPGDSDSTLTVPRRFSVHLVRTAVIAVIQGRRRGARTTSSDGTAGRAGQRGRDLETRNPTAQPRSPESDPYRHAARAYAASSTQEPPRTTRMEPDARPHGSVTDPAP